MWGTDYQVRRLLRVYSVRHQGVGARLECHHQSLRLERCPEETYAIVTGTSWHRVAMMDEYLKQLKQPRGLDLRAEFKLCAQVSKHVQSSTAMSPRHGLDSALCCVDQLESHTDIPSGNLEFVLETADFPMRVWFLATRHFLLPSS